MSRAPEDPLPSERFEDLIRRRAPAYGLEPDPRTISLTGAYLETLDSWRRKTNLTGPLPSEELVDHALESLLGASLIAGGQRVIDVGSGGGFPAVPLAIARRDAAFTLIEPRVKRVAFLRHVARRLPLRNSEVRQARIEDLSGETFDAATTRAVGALESWVSDGALVRPGGALIAWTTEAHQLEADLAHAFSLEKSLPVPVSRHREIAVFRRTR